MHFICISGVHVGRSQHSRDEEEQQPAVVKRTVALETGESAAKMDCYSEESMAYDACKMHTWTLHFITWHSKLFASYMGYIYAL